MITLLHNHNINVDFHSFSAIKAFALKDTIVLNLRLIETVRELNHVLAHEAGHIIHCAFYSLYDMTCPCRATNLRTSERKANDFASSVLVPLDSLKEAIKKHPDDYEVAEALDVDVLTLREAVQYYIRKNKL